MANMNINLKELVSAIRSELEQIDQARIMDAKPPLFHLTNLELELNFTVVENDSQKAGFDLKVVSLGSDLGTSSQEVQKVILKFEVPAEAKTSTVLGVRAHSSHTPTLTDDISPLE
ncbi:MAG TPA: trypco2 family protein [Pyrinomonadaceae bacterium]|nr:trypco2 family protein [Pyrinomonadaceae bacterium]